MARHESGVAVVQDRLYVIGGFVEPDLDSTNAVYAYDRKTDRWTPCADAPLGLTHVTAAVVENRYIWLAGGYVGKHPGKGVSDSFRYDTVDDQWEAGPPLPELRASGGLAVHGRSLHFFGGLGADRISNFGDHWALDVDNPTQWETRAPAPLPRSHAASAAVDSGIYMIGGHFGHDDPAQNNTPEFGADLDYVHRYDVQADQWEEVAPLHRRRSHCETSTFVHQGKIVCVGGRNTSPDAVSRYQKITPALQLRRAIRKIKRTLKPPKLGGLDDVIGYDPAHDRWLDIGRLPHDRYAPAAGVIGDEVVVTNGGLDAWRNPTDETLVFRIPQDAQPRSERLEFY